MGDNKEVAKESEALDSGPSRSTDLSKSLPEEAFNQLLQGKRNLLVQDYASAVSSLATACELYTDHFGEVAVECAEVHFLYGKALFRLSQQQAGVLGGAINEDAEEDDDEEEEEAEAEQSEENKESGSDKNESDAENEESENASVEEKDPSEPTDSPQGEVEVQDEASKDEAVTTTSETANASEDSKPEEKQPAESKTENDNTEAEDDLELAWNCLETSKSIFLRQGKDNKDAQLKVAEILQLLAEISMESDNNAAAIADLNESLKIKEQHLTPDDRLLAETYYQMGLALMLDKQYPDALEHFNRTQGILELRISNLKNTPADEEAGSWADIDRQKEVEDLEGVVADIKEKAEDTRELILSAKKDLEEAILKQGKLEEEAVSKIQSTDTSSKPVTNITHLLKRKKPDEDSKDSEAKRVKIASGVQNGETKVAE